MQHNKRGEGDCPYLPTVGGLTTDVAKRSRRIGTVPDGMTMDNKTTILIVDDKESERFLLESLTKGWGFIPLSATSGTEALDMLKSEAIALILSDMVMPCMDGLQFLKEVRTKHGGMPFIMLTAHGSVNSAVAAIKEGANDYILKPVNPEELREVLRQALNYHRMSEENKKLKERLSALYSFRNIVTRSPLMTDALKLAEKVASSPYTTVAIYGESGTGKEVLARAIHHAGEGMENRFVAVNCSAIPSTLLESELFGHVKGAFTGADRDRDGKFAIAHGGTILLDEIGDMPLELQAKLLRVLEERVYEKLGSNKPVKTDCRVIAATHRDLEDFVRQGKFREDLYHRINIFPISLPSLRDRKEDMQLLTDFFIGQLRQELGKPIPGMSQKAMDVFLAYHWPGNIRELKNCLERAAIMTDNELIKPEHLTINAACKGKVEQPSGSANTMQITIDFDAPNTSLDSVVDGILQKTIDKCGNNKTLAAELLKVNRKMFYRRR